MVNCFCAVSASSSPAPRTRVSAGSVTRSNTITVISNESNPVFARTDVLYKARLIEGALVYHGTHAIFAEGLAYDERPIQALSR